MPSLDRLRGLAILLVILFHGYGTFRWVPVFGGFWGTLGSTVVGCGRFGVNVFFVLSGFLITGILLRNRTRPDYYRNFYMHRVLRILPVYLLVLVILLGLHVIDVRFALAALLFLANFSRLFGAPMTEYGSLWSLAVEEHFYLLWPTCVRHLKERTMTLLLVAALIGEPLLRLLGAHISSHLDIHYKTPFVLDFLAYGALLSLLVNSGRIRLENVRRIGTVLVTAGVFLGAVSIWVTAFHNNPTMDALEDLPFTWGACGLLLLGLKHDHARLETTGRTDSEGFLAFFGYISYGLYLIQVLVYQEAKNVVLHHVPATRLDNFGFYTVAMLACIAISTVLAFLSRRYFEAPILRLKSRWPERSLVESPR